MSREDLRAEYALDVLILRAKKGCRRILAEKKLCSLVIVYWVMVLLGIAAYHPSDPASRIMWLAGLPLTVALAGTLFAVFFMAVGTPRGATRVAHNLRRAGVVNAVGEPPVLIDVVRREAKRVNIMLWQRGISMAQYQDMADKVESALNCRLVQVVAGAARDTVWLHLAPGDTVIPACVEWSDTYLDQRDFVLALGVGLDGVYTVDLNVIPHLLIAGGTGSGKTVLIKTLIYQGLKKKADVYLIDLKGGLDYPTRWKQRDCSYCDDQQAALALLSQIVEELQRRKALLAQQSCPNVAAYNMTHSDQLRRIMIVLDEIAELTDTTGLDKPHKDLVYQTIGHLSTIARMGRAYGIHLIVGTQRPDATILPEQIKNNCDIRICGRADHTLSMIILDNTDAADTIPKDSRGRFLVNDGTEFQGFWLPL